MLPPTVAWATSARLRLVAGIPAEPVEGLVDGEALTFRDHALGLFDDDTAGQRRAELSVDVALLDGDAVLQDSDDGKVIECLRDSNVVVAERSGLGAEQIEGTGDLAARPHRGRNSSEEPGLDGDGREAGPATVDGGQVLVHDRLTGGEAAQARTFLGLDLEQLDDAHGFVR